MQAQTRHEHRLGVVRVWGEPRAPEAFVEAFATGGPSAVASWPGSWAAALRLRGESRVLVAVDAFAGVPLFVCRGQVSIRFEDFAGAGALHPDAVRRHIDFEFDRPWETWVRDVFRVPAGYGGWSDSKTTRLARIWVPSPSPVCAHPERALRKALTEAVDFGQARAGDWLALSGGLDSSILAGLLGSVSGLSAVSNRFGHWTADEGPYIEAVLHKTGLEGVSVASSGLDPLEVLGLLAPPGLPPVIVNHHLNLALMRECHGRLWTGFGGDEVVGHGFDVVRGHIQEGRPLRAAWDAGWLALRYRHEAEGLVRSSRRWAGRWWYALQRDGHRKEGPRPRSNAGRRLEWMTSPVVSRSREEQTRLAACVGVGLVMPFLDSSVAEVMMRVPTAARVRRGRTRSVARAAFHDLLPENVLKRPEKADLSRSFLEPFERSIAQWEPLTRTPLLKPWVSASEIRKARRDFDAGDGLAAAWLWRVVGAARWLECETPR